MEPPNSRLRFGVALALLVAYSIVVVFAVFWPTPIDRDYQGSIVKLLDVLHRHGLPDWFGYNKLEFVANIGMFVPLGFLIALVLPARAWWASVLILPLASATIELLQGAILSERFASPWDVAANSTGALVGALLAVTVRALVHARDQKVIARALYESTNPQVGGPFRP